MKYQDWSVGKVRLSFLERTALVVISFHLQSYLVRILINEVNLCVPIEIQSGWSFELEYFHLDVSVSTSFSLFSSLSTKKK